MTLPVLRSLVALLTTQVAAQPPPHPAPSELVARAPKEEWLPIAPADLLVLELKPLEKGKPRRVVLQLISAPFSEGWVANVRTLARAHWWDGLSVNRVQDNYVVQWGDANAENPAKAKRLPAGLTTMPASAYVTTATLPRQALLPVRDAYAPQVGITPQGWPFASDGTTSWPVHCYGMVGVGRELPPDTGSGAELYVVNGHAPRHLDRNLALIGRVIDGMEHLTSLPRGTGALGFYERPAERVPIVSLRVGTEVKGLATYEFLSPTGPTFAAWVDARSNRRDPFFVTPAGGADVCNLPVPVRRAP